MKILNNHDSSTFKSNTSLSDEMVIRSIQISLVFSLLFCNEVSSFDCTEEVLNNGLIDTTLSSHVAYRIVSPVVPHHCDSHRKLCAMYMASFCLCSWNWTCIHWLSCLSIIPFSPTSSSSSRSSPSFYYSMSRDGWTRYMAILRNPIIKPFAFIA